MSMLLKRYFWVVPVVTTMLCSYLAARAATSVIDAKLVDGEEAPRQTQTRRLKPPPPPKPAASKDADVVIARNMFCSTCEPPKLPTDPVPPTNDGRPPTTALPLILSATVFAKERPEFSSATIINTTSFKSGSYGKGDVIPDAGPIVDIKPKWVDFKNTGQNSRVERIELGGVPQAPALALAPPPPPPPPTEPATPESDLNAAIDRGVKKIDDTHYEIDRSLVEKILGDPSVVMRQARIVPSIVGGKPNGFKLYAIRPNSVFAKIGLQNGDTVASINGFEMTSPDKALEVYTKVRSASNLSISIMRRGQPSSMEYTIK